MRVGLLLIGDELLSGKIQDRNGHLVAKSCFKQGLDLVEMRVVADEVTSLAAHVKQMKSRFDVVLTSGGIGPTHDDKTYEALSLAFDRPLEIHEPTRAKLEKHLLQRGQTLNSARLKMVNFPAGARVETFPDIWLPLVSVENVFILPGVPSLFALLLPMVFARYEGTPKHLLELATQTAEGDLAADLEEALRLWPTVTIGSYPQERGKGFRVRLCLEGPDLKELDEATSWLEARIGGERL